jgi:hypothetical protein
VLQGLVGLGEPCRERDRERQRHVRPARATPNKRVRVAHRAETRGAPLPIASRRGTCEGGRVEGVVAGERDAQSRHHLGSVCQQWSAGVGAELSVSSACKRTREGAAGEATIGSAQAPRSGVGRSVGTRDNWSAAEIAKGHLAPATPSAFGCLAAAVLATRCDPVPDTAGPPRIAKRVLEPTEKAIKRWIRGFARPQGREEAIEGVLGRCALRSLTGAQCKSARARRCSTARLRAARDRVECTGNLGSAPLGRQRTSEFVTAG